MTKSNILIHVPTLNFISKKVPVITRLKLTGNKCTFFLRLCQKKCQNTVAGISQSGYFGCIKPDRSQQACPKASCSPRLVALVDDWALKCSDFSAYVNCHFMAHSSPLHNPTHRIGSSTVRLQFSGQGWSAAKCPLFLDLFFATKNHM